MLCPYMGHETLIFPATYLLMSIKLTKNVIRFVSKTVEPAGFRGLDQKRAGERNTNDPKVI
jgi:hypothetical protein